MATLTTTHAPVQILDLQSVYTLLKPELDAAVHRVMASGNYIGGEEVKSLRSALSAYLGGVHVVTCANGTDALQIAYMALGLQAGDQIVIPSFNYVAAAEAAALLSLEPVFVDVDKNTFNLDASQLETALMNGAKAVVAVHLFGQAVDMEAVMAISEKYNVPVIEDNAQAIGAEIVHGKYAGKKLGTIGAIGTTSFFPSKNLGCMGDGGALFTNDTALLAQIEMIANHGQKVKYKYEMIGVNSRLDAIQAAILGVKLPHLDQFIQRRQAAATFYDQALAHLPWLKTPARLPSSTHVFHQYCIQVDSTQTRDGLKAWLASAGIQSMIYYPKALHLNDAYLFLGYAAGDFPVSEDLTGKVLALPMHSELTPEALSFVAESISTFNRQKG